LNVLVTENLQGNGCAYWYISPGLAAGAHTLVAFYSGDTNNHPEESATVPVIVNPVPVNLSASCWNASFPYGANYQCTINASSNAGAVQGVASATYDGAPINAVPLSGGNAQLSLPQPVVGNHTLAISYAPQGNFAGAGPRTFNFTVTPAPVNIALSPSTWYSPVGSSLTFSVTTSSWSAGPPSAKGSVSFYDGSALLATVPVNSNGGATYTTNTLPVGPQTIKATYSGGTNYATGSASVTVTLAP
jgi:Bacterial Ig-like domain (group 3)